MEREILREMDVAQEIIDVRPKDKKELDKYWRRYESLAEEVFFNGEFTTKRFKDEGLGLYLREGMTLENVGDAIDIGRFRGLGETNREFACMIRELEKVIGFGQLPKEQKQKTI